MLAIACGLAESKGLKKVYIANHAGDHAIYPDCRATFIESMSEAMAYGTYENIKITTPSDYFMFKSIMKSREEESVFGF